MRESPFTKKRREKFTTMLDPDLRDVVKKMAIDKKQSVADIINELLRNYVVVEQKKPNS